MNDDMRDLVRDEVEQAVSRERRSARRRLSGVLVGVLVISLPFAAAALPMRTFSSGDPIMAADFQTLWDTVDGLEQSPVVAESMSTGNYTTTSPAYTTVRGEDGTTLVEATVTTTGGPVYVYLGRLVSPSATATESFVSVESAGTETAGRVRIQRGTDTTVAEYTLATRSQGSGATLTTLTLPPSSFSYLDTPPAGTHTYRLQAQTSGSGPTVEIRNVKLVAVAL